MFGYNRPLSWEQVGELRDRREASAKPDGVVPGMHAVVSGEQEAFAAGELWVERSGPGACLNGYETFIHLRTQLDGCLTGARLAKDRAAQALTGVMIPEALDYPL